MDFQTRENWNEAFFECPNNSWPLTLGSSRCERKLWVTFFRLISGKALHRHKCRFSRGTDGLLWQGTGRAQVQQHFSVCQMFFQYNETQISLASMWINLVSNAKTNMTQKVSIFQNSNNLKLRLFFVNNNLVWSLCSWSLLCCKPFLKYGFHHHNVLFISSN